MLCPKCSFDNPENALFCSKCGSALGAKPAQDGYAPYGANSTDAYTAPSGDKPEEGKEPEVKATSDGYMPYSPSADGGYNTLPTSSDNTYENTQSSGAYTAGYSTPQYGAQYSPLATGDASKDSLAVVGFVFAIISAVCCCLTGLNIIAGIIGIIFGALGLKSQKRGLAIAAIIIGAAGVLFAIFAIILFVYSGGVEAYNEIIEELLRELDGMNV